MFMPMMLKAIKPQIKDAKPKPPK